MKSTETKVKEMKANEIKRNESKRSAPAHQSDAGRVEREHRLGQRKSAAFVLFGQLDVLDVDIPTVARQFAAIKVARQQAALGQASQLFAVEAVRSNKQ